ncbi:MAG: L,D-transpeptidase family protein [Magnetococcales bacterium]|nr:L,D-transpeptidase family protein [Magnetococcales bacterium]
MNTLFNPASPGTKRGWMPLLALMLGLQGCANFDLLAYSPERLYPQKIRTIREMTVRQETTLPVDGQKSGGMEPARDLSLDKIPMKVQRVVERYDEEVRSRLIRDFKLAGLPYPSARLALLAFKKERRVELWGGDATGPMKQIKSYPFTAFSGELGPKRRQGDRQIPEGIYRITFLNPNSAYHLSMKLDYPNEFDRAMAELDQRQQLGGDIFIHGDSSSIGCIALGNRSIEELFVLTAWAGMENVQVIVAPYDLRRNPEIKPLDSVPWTRELYATIQGSLLPFQQ